MDYYIYKIFGYKTKYFLHLSDKKIQKTYKNFKIYNTYIQKKNINNNFNNIKFNKIYYDKIKLYYDYYKKQLMNEYSIYNYWIY